MTELRGNEAWTLAVMLAQGREAEAVLLLEALNRVQIAFGHEPYAMPEPASVGLPELVTCPAMSDVLGEQLVDVEHLGPGRIAA